MHPTFRNAGPSGRRFLLTALAWRVYGRVKESVCIAEMFNSGGLAPWKIPTCSRRLASVDFVDKS